MDREKKRSSNYKFTDKIHPPKAIASVGLEILTLVLFFTACYLSFQNRGNGTMCVGVLGMLAFLSSLFGLYLGIKSIQTKQELHYRFPVLGIGGNGLLAVLFLLMYILGAYL
ncbi:MAG: DUF6142 family protein [Clostridiales bacterium]|nr:DUF6142 family protein [Clostridiales bacterium]